MLENETLEVEKKFLYNVEGSSDTFVDHYDDFLLCLPELLNDNKDRIYRFSANNYYNDKYNIFADNLDGEVEKKVLKKYGFVGRYNEVTDSIPVFDRETKKCGFINLEGNIVIPCEYDSVSEFVNGVAKVKVDDKWYFIDKECHVVLEPSENEDDFYSFSAEYENACVHNKYVSRMKKLEFLSNPKTDGKSDVFCFDLSYDSIHLVTEYNVRYLIIKNGETIASINEEEKKGLIKRLKNI